jgi:colicin import membrane protein
MSIGHRSKSSATSRRSGAASFRYGYREVKKKLPNGEVDFERVPLTLEDVLHPRFEDTHELNIAHYVDCSYMYDVFGTRLVDDPLAVVFSDVGIFWDIPKLKHHSPDISVIFGVQRRRSWDTFHVAEEKVRPTLIIEVTSPATRVNDVKTKVVQYALAGVPYYVIADARGRPDKRRLTFISYRLKGNVYESLPLDKQGRAWLEPVRLWLGVKVDSQTGVDRVALFDPDTNQEIGDYTAIHRALEAEVKERTKAERRADSEAEARAQAEARVRELEAELRRLRGRNSH